MKKSKRGLWILGFLCVMVSGIVMSNSKSRAKTVIYPTVASGEQVKESNNLSLIHIYQAFESL